MAAKSTKKNTSFEAGLETLEKMAQQMENADLPLDELMKLYEDGMALTRELEAKLSAAKGRMLEIQKGEDGKPVAVPCQVEQQLTLIQEDDEE
ncbi:MAG: exodeoxyribonuclease VII small subunit [Clostridiales bacterium]|nr:exodeoxyribonuclease VII small subunit [Clostridiales bacterium]